AAYGRTAAFWKSATLGVVMGTFAGTSDALKKVGRKRLSGTTAALRRICAGKLIPRVPTYRTSRALFWPTSRWTPSDHVSVFGATVSTMSACVPARASAGERVCGMKVPGKPALARKFVPLATMNSSLYGLAPGAGHQEGRGLRATQACCTPNSC